MQELQPLTASFSKPEDISVKVLLSSPLEKHASRSRSNTRRGISFVLLCLLIVITIGLLCLEHESIITLHQEEGVLGEEARGVLSYFPDTDVPLQSGWNQLSFNLLGPQLVLEPQITLITLTQPGAYLIRGVSVVAWREADQTIDLDFSSDSNVCSNPYHIGRCELWTDSSDPNNLDTSSPGWNWHSTGSFAHATFGMPSVVDSVVVVEPDALPVSLSLHHSTAPIIEPSTANQSSSDDATSTIISHTDCPNNLWLGFEDSPSIFASLSVYPLNIREHDQHEHEHYLVFSYFGSHRENSIPKWNDRYFNQLEAQAGDHVSMVIETHQHQNASEPRSVFLLQPGPLSLSLYIYIYIR